MQRDYSTEPIKRGEKPNKDDLKYLYLDLNLTLLEVAEIMGTSRKKVQWFVKEYGLTKSREMSSLSQQNYSLKTKGYKCIFSDPERRAKFRPVNVEEKVRKTKETCLKRYGVDHPFKNKELLEKRKQTCLEKYGTEYAINSKIVKDKIADTCLEKYGSKTPFGNKEIRDKIKNTYMEKYGVDNPRKADEVKQKIKENTNNEERVKKIQSTCIERYGSKSPFGDSQVQQKSKQTNIEKYGVDNFFKSDKLKEKIKEKYGTYYTSQIHYSEKTREILSSRESFQSYLESFNNKPSLQEISKDLGIGYSTTINNIHRFQLLDFVNVSQSSYEIEINNLFDNIFVKTRTIIAPQEIDLYYDEKKFGIEFNGTYWHSLKRIDDIKYHQKKSLLAESKGIQLYHIFEYEWINESLRNKMIQQIHNKIYGYDKTIGARKCCIQEVSSKEANQFLEENHLQGRDNSCYRIGLFFNSELISLMTFSKPRFNKKFEWELSRYCSRLDCQVAGGASKLFKHFIEVKDPSSVISYCNIGKATGGVYEQLGFKLDHIAEPNYIWTNGAEILSRYQTQKHKLSEYYHLGNTEDQIMTNRGFLKIYDCGNKVFIYIKK